MKLVIVSAVLAVVAGLAGCGGSGGACVDFSSGGTSSICHGGWDPVDCHTADGDEFYDGKSCADIGYTKPCGTGFSDGCYCQPSDPLCG